MFNLFCSIVNQENEATKCKTRCYVDYLPALPEIPEIRDNATVDQRVELILDLTRRLELLDELLSAARAKRCSSDTEISLTEMCYAEIDSMIGV